MNIIKLHPTIYKAQAFINKNMTDKEIEKYIDHLNNNTGQECVFTRPISETIEVGKVWCEQPNENNSISSSGSYRFFFIKNTLGIYVSAILDMNRDIPWLYMFTVDKVYIEA